MNLILLSTYLSPNIQTKSFVTITFKQVAVVSNNQSMQKLPKVEGLLSYLLNERKLYLKEKSQWEALATEKEVSLTGLIAF
jgi:hypothetical protein